MGNVRSKRRSGVRRPRWVLASLALLAGVLSMAAVAVEPPAPAQAMGDAGGSTISAGSAHTCGVTTAGAATCWGLNTSGQLGTNSTTASPAPVAVTGLSSGVTAISAGGTSSCAVVSGAAWCWGANASGQLGNDSTTPSLVPVQVSGLTSGVTAISVGTSHSCAVVSGAAWCWGSNTNGRLGNDSTTASSVPVPVSGLTSGVTAISAGTAHSCAVVSGAATCWGNNGSGRLGDGSTTQSLVPVPVSGLTSGVTAVSAGELATCAVASGAATCWGSGQDGALGTGSSTNQSVPTQVSGLTSGVTAISAGRFFGCAVVSGAARCWGYNEAGQLGSGTRSDGTGPTAGSNVPLAVVGLDAGITTIAAGYDHACAVASDGTASCWGRNTSGKTGNGYANSTPTPQQADGVASGATGVAAGSNTSCAVRSGAAACWGYNVYNQVSTSSNDWVYSATQVSGLSADVTAVSTGSTHSCAIVAGSAKCWGESAAMLGSNASIDVTSYPTPQQVVGLTSGVTSISAAAFHTCAVADGSAKCWGSGGNGRLGAAGAGTWSTPQQVVGLTSGVTSISAGGSHSCAVVSGAAWCWGSNGSGRLGNNSTTASSVPVQVSGLTSGVTAISAGTSHSCALVAGAVQCWGSNASLQSGSSTTADSLTPVQVTGLTAGATSVAAGATHTCAAVSGAARCWGNSSLGALGAMDPSVPAEVLGGLTFASGAGLPEAPTISGSRSPAPNAAGWNNEPVVVSFTCTSTALASCTSPVTVSTDGASQSVTGTVTDTASQSATTTVSDISIDRVAPTLAGVATTAPNAAGWHRAPVTMAWTCDDALSGIASGACPAPSDTVGEGSSVSVSGSVLDRAGNQTTASSESVQVDLTKPSTGVSSPPTWSDTDVTLTLSPTDALSGVASTSYRVDGGAVQDGTSTLVTGQGVHSVEFWSVDVAGNEENHQTVQVRIDVQAPSITASRSVEPNANGWNNGPVTVSFDCGDEDGGSGVVSCSSPQAFTTEVDTTATGNVADAAGNTASVQVPVRIDLTAPTVTAVVPAANANGWFNAPVQVPFTCADTGGSGIATCPSPVVFAGDGADQPVTGEAVDAAGNTGSASGATVSLDATAPTISGAAVEPANPGGGHYGDVTVRWTCADALSGIVACPADVVVSGEGVHVVSRSVTDRAGNTSTAEVTVQIDLDPSTDPGTVHGTITDAGSGALVVGATVTLRTTANAIVATTTTATDGTYTFPAVADGTYKLYAVKNLAYQGSYRGGTFTVAHGTATTADHALAPTLTLSGTVRSAGGTPIAGATIRVAPSGRVAVSDASGSYQVTGLLPGAVTVKAMATGYVTPADAAFTLSSDRTHDVALAAAAAGGGLKGTVTAHAGGAPLPGATVRIWLRGASTYSQTVSTGADGRYSIPSLAVGTYEVDVVAVDHQVRWFGDSLSRSGAAPIALTTSCTASPDPTWGDPCAFPASVALRR